MTLVAVVLITLLLRAQVVEAFKIPAGSVSMTPTLEPGDRFLVDRTPDPGDITRGTVIVFDTPPRAATPERVLVKRVIGRPGDVIELLHGRVAVNGSLIAEPYLASGTVTSPRNENPAPAGCTAAGDSMRCVVAAGQVFVLGDNRSVSLDSRSFGAVPARSITGVARVVVWPLSHAGGIETSS